MREWCSIVLMVVATTIPLGGCGGNGGSGGGEILLGGFAYHTSVVGSGSTTNGFILAVGYDTGMEDADYQFSPPLTGGDVGSVFQLHRGDNLDFDHHLSVLMNGDDDIVRYGLYQLPSNSWSSIGGNESNEILAKASGLGGPDFAGATITRMTLEVTGENVTLGDPYTIIVDGILRVYGFR